MKFFKESLKYTKIKMISIILLSLIISYLASLIPLFVKYALDGIVFQKESVIPNYVRMFFYDKSASSKLFVICLFLFFINLLLNLVKLIKNKIVTNYKIQINKNVRSKVLGKTRKISYLVFYDQSKEKIIQRTNNDTDTYISFFDEDLIMCFELIFTLIFSFYNTFKLNSLIGFYFSVCLILQFIFAVFYFNKSKIYAKNDIKASEELIKQENNMIKNIKMIKMYNKEEVEKEKFLKLNNNYNKTSYEKRDIQLKYHTLCHFINISSVPFILTIGGISIAKNNLSFGSLAAILEYRQSVFEGIADLVQKIMNINDFYVSYKNLVDFLSLPEEDNKNNIVLSGNIKFDNVNIYIDNNLILENLNFIIEENKSYALVGDNGSGKSVLLKTILGIYKYTGNIYIGNTNIKKLNTETITQSVSLVLSEPYLFNTTIKENITFSDKDDYKNVCQICDIYGEIMKLKYAFKTEINENSNLSGGQKQRLTIARSLYKNTNILLLDNSLSKLDTRTKNKVLNNILNLNKTLVIATYDPYTIKKADNVLFINNKKIISTTSDKLLRENISYRKLININENKLGEEYD